MSDDYRDGGTLPVSDDGTVPIPADLHKPRTVRSSTRTVVQYEDSEQEYDSPNPELREARADRPDVFYLVVAPHDMDAQVCFRVVPRGEREDDGGE